MVESLAQNICQKKNTVYIILRSQKVETLRFVVHYFVLLFACELSEQLRWPSGIERLSLEL